MAPTNSLSLLSLALIPNNRVFIVVVVTDVIVFVPGVTHQWTLSCPLNHWTTNRIESVGRAVEKKRIVPPTLAQLSNAPDPRTVNLTNRYRLQNTLLQIAPRFSKHSPFETSKQTRRSKRGANFPKPNRRIPTTTTIAAIHFSRLAYSSVHGTLRRSSVANQRNAVLQRSKLLKNTARTHTVKRHNVGIGVSPGCGFVWAWKGALLHSHCRTRRLTVRLAVTAERPICCQRA